MKTHYKRPTHRLHSLVRIAAVLISLFFHVQLSAQAIIETANAGGGAVNWGDNSTWVGGIVPQPGDHVIIRRNVQVNVASVSIGSLTIDATRTLSFTAGNTTLFEVTGQVTVNGTFNDGQAAGINRFGGGITNNTNTFTSASPVEFFGASQNLEGAGQVNLNGTVTIMGNINVTNNVSHANGLFIGGNLDGFGIASLLTNTTFVRYNGSVMPFLSAGQLNASNTGNTFQYGAGSGDQTVRPTIYYHLTLAGGGNKHFTDVNIMGNFIRAAGTVVQSTGTIRFSGNANATYTNAATNAWNDVVIEKTGASLTLANTTTPTAITTTTLACTTLTIGIGTLNMGTTTTRTLTVISDFAGAGTLDASGADHTVTLRGENNSIGTFNTGSSNTLVNYSLLSGSSQTIFGSPNYKRITLANASAGTPKVLGGPVTVAGVFQFSASFAVELGPFDLTFTNTGTLTSSGATWTTTNHQNRMFVTEGAGKIILQKNSAADFTSFNNTPGLGGFIPMGNFGVNNSVNLSSLSATVAGTGRIEIRVVSTRQPNIPYYNFALQKHWKIETVNLSAITANIAFNFQNPVDVIGSVTTYIPIVYNASSLVTPNSPSAPGANPFSSTGTNYLAGDWTAYDPAVRTTLYSYQSGNWNDPLTWTTDPSGTTSVFPMVPGTGDAVVILNGRNVFTTVTRSVASMGIQEGATLDLQGTTGNDLGVISGQGRLRLSTVNLPAGNITQFVSANGGTIEYYNLGTGTFVLPTTAPFTNTYNNLLVTNSTTQSFELRTNASITLNGNFSITRSGTGSPVFMIGNTATNRSFTVNGNFNVGTGCTFRPSTDYNGAHTLTVRGNSTVSGTALFQNSATYNDAATGRISITFSGTTSNTTFFANPGSTVRFWAVTMDKTEGAEIFINGASGTITFNSNPGINIQNTNGTMRLGSGVTLTLGTNFDSNHHIGMANRFPVLWIDGANVTGGVGNSIVPYGTLKITSGTIDAVTGSSAKTITLRENGLLQVEGGTVTTACIRISNIDEFAHRGAYIQTGGTVNVTGQPSPVTHMAAFSLPQPENVFKMSGGTLSVSRGYAGSVCPTGGILIGSSDQNYEVTGGTVNVYSTNNFLFDISSTAPFYNMNVYKVGTGANGQVRLRSYNWSPLDNAASARPSGAYPLRILNNFVVQSTGSPIFDTGDQDVIVNGNMTIETGASYVSGNNTLRFENASPQTFTVNGGLQFFGITANLINAPEDIINGANYTIEGITSTENVTESAPDGTETAERMLETTTTGWHRFYTPFIPSSGPITASIFVKPNGRNFVSLRVGSISNLAIAIFDLSTGTLVSTNPQVISANISPEANGWFRISITSPGHDEYRMRLYLQNNAANESYAGNASLGVYAWGVMVQNGDVLSPYTPANNTGLNNLAITKSGSSVLTIAGSQGTINLNANLSLNSGLLNIGGKTLNVAGNVINNSEIQATATGRVRLNGTFPQNISGNGSGIFHHLVLASGSPNFGTVRYTTTANFRILSSLEMATNHLLSIGNKRITFAPAATLQSTSGSFSNNRFIRTAGFLSDGGIEKEYNSSNTSFTFAFGTGNVYTPASISFTSNPSAYGSLNVRPVAVKHLYVTDPDALDYYWKVNQNGFSGIAANSVNAVFTYGDIAVNPTITNYIPGYYNYAEIAYTTINNVNAVNEGSKTITFNPFSKLEGDYTAGVPAAFGAVVPYYSRQNGNWNNAATWSNTGHGGSAASGTPGGSNPVYIGDGAGYNHTVTVTANNTFSGSLIVDAGSTLDIGATIGHNFGALPYSTAGGAGTLRISSSTLVAEFPGGDFGLFFTNEGGTAEYYGTGTSYTLPSVTAAPNSLAIESYRHLRIVSSSTHSIYLPNQELTILGNFTVNGASNSIATMSDLGSKTLQVNGNLNVIQGIFELPPANSQVINVNGNITVGSNGIFRSAASGSVTHQVNVYGGFVNNGAVHFNNASRVSLNMIGNSSATIGGTNAGAQLNLGPLTINKGNSQALEVNITSLGSISAPTNNWLNLQNGTLRISRPGILTLNDQPGNDFFLPASTALVLNNSGLTLYAGAAASNDCDFVLAGRLELLAGTMNIGLEANNNHNDIEYAAAGVPELIISGNSSLSVNGQIRRSVNVLLGALSYTQSGNSIVLVRGKMPETSSFNLNRAKFEILNAGSQFSMSDNALLIVDRNGPASNIFGDIYLSPSSGNAQGGEIRVGTGNSGSNTLFEINSTIPLYNLAVDGTATSKILRLLGNPLTVKNNLRVLGESVFDANSLNVQIGRNLTVENSSAATGLNVGGYRVQSSAQTTTFNGSANNQSISGTGSNLINFANLVLNNTLPSGSVSVAGGTPLRVASNLTLTEGSFGTGTSLVTVLGNITTNVIHTSSAGGYIVLSGAGNQTISGNGSGQFGNVRIDNTAGVEILNEARINGDLNLVNGILYLNNHRLTLGTAANVTTPSSLSQNRMIRLNGVASDAGLRKMYAAGSGNFTFPIGVTLKYTPATISVASNSLAGTVTIRPVNTKHPATTDPANAELTYHWVTQGTGFSGGASFTHQYNYVQTDAINGNENLYVAGRYFSNQWVPQNGIPGTVNASTNTITLSGVNYINGEFTAGEPQEFGDIQVYYSRTNGNWTDESSWSIDPILQHTGAPALAPPTFNPIVIASGHTITGNTNNLGAPTAEINGTLNLNNTIGHNLGIVTGTGTIRMTPTGSNEFVFPGGTYSTFVAAGGGTVEYSSAVTAALPSRTTYNNLVFTGTGTKTLYNSDILVNGHFNISQGQVTNPFNRQMNLRGDFINSAGFTAFNGGTGVVNMSGTNQAFTGSTQFSNLTISGGGIKTLNASIEVNTLLQLGNGIIETGGNLVIIPLGGNVAGANAASYVNGNLQKAINNSTGSRLFEVGDASRYTPANLNFTGTVSGSGSLIVSTTPGDHADIAASGLNPSKSVNRFWTIINSGLTISAYSATFNFVPADLDAGVNTSILDIGLRTGSWTIPATGSRTATSTQVINLSTFGDFQVGEQLGGGYTWTGVASNDWHNPNNWLPVGVPGTNDDILVPNTTNKPSFPTLINGTCRNAVFQANAEITIPENVILTVVGNWSASNTPVKGSGTLRFTSPVAAMSGTTIVSGIVSVASGANLTTNNGLILNNGASLMHGTGTPGAGGAVTGNVVIRRTGFADTRYNYWSSPITNGQLNSLGSNRYIYNPAAATASSGQGLLVGWQNATGMMTTGRGYIATNSGTVNFNGIPNNGGLAYGPLSIGTHSASNLIGNPYPSAISAAAFVAANPHITGGAIYLWDDDDSRGGDYTFDDYLTWNGIGVVGPNTGKPFNGNIALGQGFFINAGNTNSVQFSNSMRTAAASTFFESESTERFWISVTTSTNRYNETLIGFKPDATEQKDQQYDALKWKGDSQLALYSLIGKEAYSIQALPLMRTDRIVPLGIEAATQGAQVLHLKQVDKLDESVMIILEDIKLGVFQNLRVSPDYAYNFNPTTDKARFRLHLTAAVEVTSLHESCLLNDGGITITNPSARAWDYTITRENGLPVDSRAAFTGTRTYTDLAPGIYHIRMNNSLGAEIIKTVVIGAGQPLAASLSPQENEMKTSQTIGFNASVSGAVSALSWDFGDGTIVYNELNPVHAYAFPGIYAVRFNVSNEKCSVTEQLTIRVTDEELGIAEETVASGLNIFPNPAHSGRISIRISQHEREVGLSILDATGKLVMSERYAVQPGQSLINVPVTALQAGVYQVVINGKEGIHTGRLTIMN